MEMEGSGNKGSFVHFDFFDIIPFISLKLSFVSVLNSFKMKVLLSKVSDILRRINIPFPHCSIWNDCKTRSIGGTLFLYSSKRTFSITAFSG